MKDEPSKIITQEGVAKFVSGIAAFMAEARRLAADFNLWVEHNGPRLAEWATALSKSLEQMPVRTRTLYIAAARDGWYLPWNITLVQVNAFARQFQDSTPEELEALLLGEFENAPQDIVARVAARFPDRELVTRQALSAHERGDYALSTLAFLVQAEGVAAELDLPSPFDKKCRDRLESLFHSVSPHSFDSILLAPLMEVNEIRLTERDRRSREAEGRGSVNLNRHEIVHGKRSNYGTQSNSLRAAMFLGHVMDVGERAHSWKREAKHFQEVMAAPLPERNHS